MKRICLFVGSMGLGGGTEHMTQVLANALARKSNCVYVLSKKDKTENPFYDLDSNIKYDVLDNDKYSGVKSIFKDILLLNRYVKKNKIEILINADVALALFSLPLAILSPKVKLVFWDHFNVSYDVANKRMSKYRQLALNYGDLYVTLTPQDANDLQWLGNKHCAIKYIPNICTYNESSEQYKLDSKLILSAGNMLPVKGFDLAIEAAEIIFKKHKDWKWEIYGDGIELETLKQKCKERGVDKYIHFPGRVKNLESAYKNAAIFVLSSKSEGFGLVLVEAQAFHLPIVAFDVPYGPRNVIRDGINGYLVEPFNIEKMASRINELIEDAEKRNEFAKMSTIDLKRWSEQSIVDEWITVLGGI